MTTMTAQSTQVYQLFIKATPEAIWDAITKPDFTTRYFYASRVEVTPERRQAFGPDGAQWRIDEITERQIFFTYLPLHARRSLPL